ncbi:MAG: restriction endonuclease subunit S, partial [Thermoguttaceae bacterium]|nr:restriction endonuclease subunit S [Thermoguttaceae bacterium]
MRFDWITKKIGDVCEIHRGSSPRPIQNFLSDKGMPWVKIADATGSNSRYILNTSQYIIEEGISKSVLVTPGTLIVSNSATPGLPKILGITACVHDGWLILSNFKGVIRDFLFYKFIDIREHLVNQANGSVFQNLKTEIVKDFNISFPSIPEQHKIVSLLSMLDDKIELNNRINANLEQQAQMLFKSWFVDFDP